MWGKLTTILALCGLAIAATGSAHASMKPFTLSKRATVAPYVVVLKIGPAEMMSMHGMTGERRLGGHAAMCHMGSSGSNMHMGSGTCNHHVEVHVYQAKSGKIVTSARVTIMLHDAAKKMFITVPIMTMEDARIGKSDFHYGNNVYAGPGMYQVIVHVNGKTATFDVQLM